MNNETKNETLLLNIIEELLGSCELNLDEIEYETRRTIDKANDYLALFGRVKE